MGWTSYNAEFYKRNGSIDRKKECDKYWESGTIQTHKVLKSRMVGSTYYGAIQQIVKCIGEDEKGHPIYEPLEENERFTFCAVFLTSVNSKDYFNFSYKPMDESCGPCCYDCPKSILDLLSETDYKVTIEWRQKCYDTIAAKKDPNALKNLKEGSVIEVTMPYDTIYFKKGEKVELCKVKNSCTNRTRWETEWNVYFSNNLMKSLESRKCYKVLKRGDK